MITEEASRIARQKYLYDVLDAKDVQASTALFAYAQFLNRHPIRYDYFPLYMKILETNNKYAIDALLEDIESESFFDFVIIPNQFVIKKIFQLLNRYRSNSIYEQTVRVLCGYLRRVYRTVEDGYRIHQINVNDLNDLAKHLDEEYDQDYPPNRVILDILQSVSELDNLNELDKEKLDTGRQANRVRGDFLDKSRQLVQAITDAVLVKSDTLDFGIVPEQLQ